MSKILKATLWLTVSVAVLSISVLLIENRFTSEVVGANDFYPRWKGTLLFFQDGISPYSEEATAEIQRGMYGRLAYPDEDQVAFAYPFYVVFLIAPLVALDISYSLATAIWFMLLLLAIAIGLAATLRLISIEFPFWLHLLFVLSGILFYNSIRTLVLGQIAGLVFALLVGTLLALKQHRDMVAGVMLAAATIKPQMSLLLTMGLLIWAIYEHRKQFLMAFFSTSGLLVAVSLIMLPTWVHDFLKQVVDYAGYTRTGSPIWLLTERYWPQLGQPMEITLSVLLLLTLFYQWFRLIRQGSSSDSLLPLAVFTLIVSNLVVPRTATTNQIVLFLPIIWVLGRSVQRYGWTPRHIVIFHVTTFIAGWFLFLNTHNGTGEKPLMYLYLPSLALVMLAYDFFISRQLNRNQVATPTGPTTEA